MRRKDKEINEYRIIETILHQGQLCHLGLCVDNLPYVVTVNYGYNNRTLYIHSAPKGKKIDIIKTNNTVHFAIETHLALLEAENACDFNQKFKSVHGTGKAIFIEDETSKREALDIIMHQHGATGPFNYTPVYLKQVCIIKIEIESITGKQSGF